MLSYLYNSFYIEYPDDIFIHPIEKIYHGLLKSS